MHSRAGDALDGRLPLWRSTSASPELESSRCWLMSRTVLCPLNLVMSFVFEHTTASQWDMADFEVLLLIRLLPWSLLDLPAPAGVGKSCLLLRFSEDSFTSSFITTIG